jgi:hypothetical protein
MNDFTDLSEKIAQAKRRLPLPALMARLGLGEHAKKSARCPFPDHPDKRPSFSVFPGNDGFFHYKCFAGCGDGDEIMFIKKLRRVSLSEAMSLYLDMAGFPPSSPPVSRECPESRASLNVCVSESRCVSLSPVSEGQSFNDEKEKVLRALAARNACSARNTARKRRFKLVRDLKAMEKGIGRQLKMTELRITFDEWYRLSLPFLDPAKTRDDYWMLFLAELQKVAVPTGEGALTKALENVAKISLHQLPVIPGYPDAREECRRLVALHCELSRSSANGVYFLS